MKDVVKRSLFALAFLLLTDVYSASSRGLFDHLDYCIEQKRQFTIHRNNMHFAVRRLVSEARDPRMFSKPENRRALLRFAIAWSNEMTNQLRVEFVRKYGTVIRGSGGNVETAFRLWWVRKGFRQAGGQRGIFQSALKAFRRMALKEARRQSSAVLRRLENDQRNLYRRCRPDVVSQAIRLPRSVFQESIRRTKKTFKNSLFGRNFQGARRERGVVGKLLKGTTGISVRDARRNPWGGRNSEPRKFGRAIGKVFGW